ncbi:MULTISPECIES: transketolase [Anaerotruncus]|jgi:transketolase|uniref:transketolase n=1 Tax=Anaerotruncus TaxID=244127 RepID=UPI00082FA630|nr:transketolase [Anaerotruncus sp. AF02-27]
MPLTETRVQELDALCKQFRIDTVELLHAVQTGHAGGSLSVCEILVTLYMECANITPENQHDAGRDRIVLCKGHAAPMLYRCLCEKGFFPKEEMKTLRQPGSRLQGHPCSKKTPGVELSTGPLGLGLSASVGMACAKKLSKAGGYIFPVLGDGELNEGTVWEAAMSAAKFACDNLVAIVDWNKVQLDGLAKDVMPIGDLAAKWASFGWKVYECDGHNIAQLYNAIEAAKNAADPMPRVVLANTIKGKGVSFMEGTNKFHGKAITDEEYELAMRELRGAK